MIQFLFNVILLFGTFNLYATESKKTLFFSLGSNCEIASVLGKFELRHIAGPLDWLLTLDYKGFHALIEDDFEFLTDKRYLIQFPDIHVSNVHYNIGFYHDWPDLNFEQHLPGVQERIKRRAQRILELKTSNDKVFFVRGAFDTNINPFLPEITEECGKITENDALTLFQLLQRKYPNLDFILIIINYVEEYNESFNLSIDNILEYKVRKFHKAEDYKVIMDELISLAKTFSE